MTKEQPHLATVNSPMRVPLLPAASLAHREILRFLRQRHRIVGALLTPLVFWMLIGGGMGKNFRAEGMPGGAGYLEFFFPGTVVMVLLFTAVFSTISIIEDRREGFLQSVLVAPVSRSAIALGKVLGGSALALAQGMLLLCLAPMLGIHLNLTSIALATIIMAGMSLALTSLGVCIAWRLSSTQGFHAIMNLFLVPMWFLSGAMFPVPSGSHNILGWIMRANPLTYGVAGLRRALYLDHSAASSLPGLTFCLLLTAGFAAVLFALASFVVASSNSADLQ